MIKPDTTPSSIPNAKYTAAICQPNSDHSNVSATVSTMGAVTKNENVTPSGTRACTKPMNSGTDEQEQNGVTTPSADASTLATPGARPASSARVRSGVK